MGAVYLGQWTGAILLRQRRRSYLNLYCLRLLPQVALLPLRLPAPPHPGQLGVQRELLHDYSSTLVVMR